MECVFSIVVCKCWAAKIVRESCLLEFKPKQLCRWPGFVPYAFCFAFGTKINARLWMELHGWPCWTRVGLLLGAVLRSAPRVNLFIAVFYWVRKMETPSFSGLRQTRFWTTISSNHLNCYIYWFPAISAKHCTRRNTNDHMIFKLNR